MEFGGKRYIAYGNTIGDWITVWNLADLHLLTKACDVLSLRRDVARIQEDPNSFWFGGGDYADYIPPSDKRFDPSLFIDEVRLADLGSFGKFVTDKIYAELAPIKHKCLGLLYGNHEQKYQTAMLQEDLHHTLCEKMGAPNLGYSAFVDLCLYEVPKVDSPFITPPDTPLTELIKEHKSREVSSFRFFLHHGVGHAVTRTGKLTKLRSIMQIVEADIYMVGHVHDLIVNRETMISANNKCTDLEEKARYGLVTGGYLNTYVKGVTTYGERRLYTPTYLGAAKILLQGARRGERGRRKRVKTVM